MNRFIITSIALMTLIPLTATAQNKKAKIEFENLIYDMGTFPADSAQKVCKFKFTNTGDADLYIHQIFTVCGCTNASHPEGVIKPGESSYITVNYDGRRNPPGPVRKRVTVHSNAENEMVKLLIKGNMQPRKEKEIEIID